MKKESIGGFIELEFHLQKEFYHTRALALSNGRACFHLFLKEYNPVKVYIPYYTCNTLIDPLIINKIPYEFYKINRNLDPEFEKELKQGEYFLYINYSDVKNKMVEQLEKKYGSSLIIDNTQAFYHKKYSYAVASFNSCRKFFGVPDGGYLYMKKKIDRDFPENENYSTDHLISRVAGRTDVYYKQFKANEELQNSHIASMSSITKNILSQADYAYCSKKRIENFKYLHDYLGKYNQFKIILNSVGVPYAYSFLPERFIDRTQFYPDRIFISTLWEDVLKRRQKGFDTENYLSENMLPLPVDQRYGKHEMQVLAKTLKKALRH